MRKVKETENKNLHEKTAEILKDLSAEQREKVNACKTPEELIAMLDELGAALPDEAMDSVAGGQLPWFPPKP